MIDPKASIRLARPTRDLAAAERFYVQGLGLEAIYRAAGGPGEHDLDMLGDLIRRRLESGSRAPG